MFRIVKFLYRPFCKKRWDIFENVLSSIKVEPESWLEKKVNEGSFTSKKDERKCLSFKKEGNMYNSYDVCKILIGKGYFDTFFWKCNLVKPVDLRMPIPLRFKYCKVASRFMDNNKKRYKRNCIINDTLEKSVDLYNNPKNKRESKINEVLE